MMNPIPHWTKRATTQLRDAARYIATNFYTEYALAFRDDAISTANQIPSNPEIGREAFPGINRPTYRKILCKNRQWWLYYRILNDKIEIIAVKHVLRLLAFQMECLAPFD